MAAHQESDKSSNPEELLHPSHDLSTPQPQPDEDHPTIQEEQPGEDLPTMEPEPQKDLSKDQQEQPGEDLPTIKQEEPDEDPSTVRQEDLPTMKPEPDEDPSTIRQEDLPAIKQEELDQDLPTIQTQPEHKEDGVLSPTIEDDEDDKERTEPSLPRIRAMRVQTRPVPQLAEAVSSEEATIMQAPVTDPASLDDATIVQTPAPAVPVAEDATTRVKTQPLPQLSESISEEATIVQAPFPASIDDATILHTPFPAAPPVGVAGSPFQDPPTVRLPPPPPPPAWYQEQSFHLPTEGPVSSHVMTLAQATMPLGAVRRAPRGFAALKHNRSLAIALVVLVVLLLASGAYAFVVRDMLPADSAVVHITPASQTINNQYTMTAVLGAPNGSSTQVAAHAIAQSTAAKSMTVQATGHGHADATHGHGTVLVTVTGGSVTTNLRVTSGSGVSVIIYIKGTLNQGASANFTAIAENAGPSGNIPALDINGSFTDQTGDTVSLQSSAFVGGSDARDFTAVQQSDIDNAAQQLQGQISATESSDAQTKAQNQLGSGEQFFNSVQCNPVVTANHKANDEAANVAVNVVIKCAGVAYSTADVQAKAAKLLGGDANSQLGSEYILAGHVVASMASVSPFQVGDHQITFQVSARGVWSYYFSLDQQNTLASLVADKKQVDAKDLLAKQHGIANITIDTSGDLGTALPNLQHIRIDIAPVKGL